MLGPLASKMLVFYDTLAIRPRLRLSRFVPRFEAASSLVFSDWGNILPLLFGRVLTFSLKAVLHQHQHARVLYLFYTNRVRTHFATHLTSSSMIRTVRTGTMRTDLTTPCPAAMSPDAAPSRMILTIAAQTQAGNPVYS